MNIQPYLYFEGRCEEAINFYKKVVGAEVPFMMRFKEMPDPQPGSITPGTENKIMHASLKIGDSTMMVSDGRCASAMAFQGFGLTLTVKSEAEAEKYFNALSSEGGKPFMPLTKTFFSPKFGMTHDKFGVMWLVIVQ